MLIKTLITSYLMFFLANLTSWIKHKFIKNGTLLVVFSIQ
jgi:hypothetical protein